MLHPCVWAKFVPFLVLICVPPPQELLQVDQGVQSENEEDGEGDEFAGHKFVLQDLDC